MTAHVPHDDVTFAVFNRMLGFRLYLSVTTLGKTRHISVKAEDNAQCTVHNAQCTMHAAHWNIDGATNCGMQWLDFSTFSEIK
jgi:hypothetical protein